MRSVYLDHAATTLVDPRVLKKMLPYFSENFGNPDSLHACGRRAVAAVDDARDVVAALLGASASEIYFTSGGTEADNWAMRGAAHAADGKHIVVGATEHHAVLGAAEMLAGRDMRYPMPPSTPKVRPTFPRSPRSCAEIPRSSRSWRPTTKWERCSRSRRWRRSPMKGARCFSPTPSRQPDAWN